jgi:peroxiredoxin-like protein
MSNISSDATYESAARWTQRRRGLVECDQPVAAIEFSAPAEFQGDAGYWTPEHFLLNAVAACFVTTFRAIAELSRFEFVSLEVAARGTLGNNDGTLRFADIVLRPLLSIADEGQRERALRLLEKAERNCLISHSLSAAPAEIAAPAKTAVVGELFSRA